MMNSLKYEKQLELKKHINTVHCSNHLTLVQRKLFNALLLHSYHDLPHKPLFNIPVRTLCKLIGYNSNDYASLKKALLKLMTTTIEWNVIEQSSAKRQKWQASSILASVTLEEGICTYEYSSVIKEFLYRPEIYARLNMGVIAQFTSGYGLALYENCIRYQGLPQTPSFPIVTFRKLMGVAENKYQSFNSFKNRVLSIAVAEVNKYSHIKIFPELERRNQKVISIRFKFLSKVGEGTSLMEQPGTATKELCNKLINNFFLSQKAAKKILDQYEVNYIEGKIKIIENSTSFKTGKIMGLAGYLLDALKKDYKANQNNADIVRKNIEEREKKQALEKKQATDLIDHKRCYDDYIQRVVDCYLSSFSVLKRKELNNSFESNLIKEYPGCISVYRKFGLESHAIRALFNQYIQENRAMELGKVLTFEEFIVGS